MRERLEILAIVMVAVVDLVLICSSSLDGVYTLNAIHFHRCTIKKEEKTHQESESRIWNLSKIETFPQLLMNRGPGGRKVNAFFVISFDYISVSLYFLKPVFSLWSGDAAVRERDEYHRRFQEYIIGI